GRSPMLHSSVAAHRSPLIARSASVAEFAADDPDEAHALAGGATEVVRQPEGPPLGHGGDLALGGRLAAQLQPALEEHPEPGGADRVAEALQPAVGVDRQL